MKPCIVNCKGLRWIVSVPCKLIINNCLDRPSVLSPSFDQKPIIVLIPNMLPCGRWPRLPACEL